MGTRKIKISDSGYRAIIRIIIFFNILLVLICLGDLSYGQDSSVDKYAAKIHDSNSFARFNYQKNIPSAKVAFAQEQEISPDQKNALLPVSSKE